MKPISVRIVTIFFMVALSFSATAQKSKSEDEAKVKDIIAFLEYVLNTLGSSSTSARDKDVLIKESYTKIFRDAQVQIEDDLDENRKVITNKDVPAYLKDVDFFFSDVKFEFTIDKIAGGTNANGTQFYKVSTRRNLKGTTSEGNAISNTVPRYIEVNYNPNDDDLKIVSIYTREFDEKAALTNWWKELSYEWHEIFKRRMNLTDSVQLDDIKNMTSIETLDISNNEYILDLEPLSVLVNLKNLNVSRTGITDLTPIRNLSGLVELNASHTLIEDLTPLNYSSAISKLNLSHTVVSDISVIEKMPQLTQLDISNTPVIDFYYISTTPELRSLNLESTKLVDLSAVDSLWQMTDLNVSRTQINDLTALSGLKNLKTLDIDSTNVQNVGPLSTLENLQVLSANYTLVENLQPLQKLPKLQKIYCDQTRITKMVAEGFTAVRPKVLVVYDSKDFLVWWNTLPSQWQGVFTETASISLTPTKDELAKITTIDSVNLKDKYSIFDLEPLKKLPLLRILIIDKTAVHDLSPINEHREIQYLDISNTEVRDLSPLSTYRKLKELHADGSKVEALNSLYNITSLSRLYLDETTIQDIQAQEFLQANPKCLIVYKTNRLTNWWSSVSEDWKKVFQDQMDKDTTASRENLHRLVEQEKLHITDEPVRDLSALSEFVRLRELHFTGTAIQDLNPLAHLTSLQSLHATNSPLQNMETLEQLNNLEDLNIANTPISDLNDIGNLENLKKLNCSGTQIKRLDPLEDLSKLEQLDCSNTFVNKLDALEHLPMTLLKCYNTKISSRTVEKFKERVPGCEVIYYR